jgi:predicted NBD/HSP70 family sugar kinase
MGTRLLRHTDRSRLLGMAISTYGASLKDKPNIIGKAAHFQALEGLDLESLFEKEFSLKPELIDGTIAQALYEIWFNGRGGNGNLILLSLGTGIGFAIAENGRISFTRNSHPGEFGHTLYDIHGEKCECGRTGCIETVASIPALEKAVRSRLKTKEITFDEIVEMYHHEDPAVSEIVNHAASALGTSIANLVNLLIPNEIVLCGPMLKFGEKFSNIIKLTVSELAFPAFQEDMAIVESIQEEECDALGAASIFFERFFAHGFGEQQDALSKQ